MAIVYDQLMFTICISEHMSVPCVPCVCVCLMYVSRALSNVRLASP